LLLDIPLGATRTQIDKAYKRKAREVHPDIGGSDEAMQKLNAAYTVLMERFRAPHKNDVRGDVTSSQEEG